MSLLVISGSSLLNAQVTVGSNIPPNVTLDVVAADPSNTTTPEGVIAPRLTGDQIKAKDDIYGTPQNGAIVYATSAVSGVLAGKTRNINAQGYYYYDAPNSVWHAIKPQALNITDVKTGSYVIGATDDVVLLEWEANGYTITLPGIVEGIPVGKIIHVSNSGNRGGAILAGATDMRVPALRQIDARTDYAYIYIGNNVWLSMTAY